jgi:hypothetical protein
LLLVFGAFCKYSTHIKCVAVVFILRIMKNNQGQLTGYPNAVYMCTLFSVPQTLLVRCIKTVFTI